MKRARILYHSFGIVERNCKFEGVKESSNTVSQDAITKCSVSVILTSTASVTLTSVFDMCPFGSYAKTGKRGLQNEDSVNRKQREGENGITKNTEDTIETDRTSAKRRRELE